MSSESKFYVYQYFDKNGNLYYIGKGSGTRYRERHLYVDVPPVEQITFADKNMSEDEAYELEEQLTKKYGLKIDGSGILENRVHGGKSTHVPSFTGFKHSDLAKKAISEKNTGKIRTEEQRKNYSKPKTKEHAENIRKSNLGRPSCEKRNNAISKSMKNKRWFRNETNSVFCEPGQEPGGYYPGRIMNKTNRGEI